MNINRLIEKYKSGETSVYDYTAELIEKISADETNSFISINENALERASELDEKLKNGEELGMLFGVPISLKDNVMTVGIKSTCASRMLENYVPPYNATLVEKLNSEDAIIIGKTNMDEFAMGGTSETSYFGPVKNPIDNSLVPGGSSSGAAAGQAAGYSVVAIGTDTGGSVRQPASYCSILGYLPSYGSISRYGVASLANSLDHVGIFADDIEDIMNTLNVIGGNDPKDATSVKSESLDLKLNEMDDLSGVKVGYICDFEVVVLDDKVRDDYNAAINTLIKLGAELVEVKLENQRYLSPTYSVINTAEASSNLSRYDGIRYGYLAEDYEGLDELYEMTRSEGFGEEVQRRIAIGMYYLGSEFERDIYNRALKVRTLVVREVESIFNEFDILLTPSATTLPPVLGEGSDSVKAFNSGDYHVLANLTGRCAISIPMSEGIGGSVQLMADRFNDEKLLNVANRFYKEVR